MNEKEDLIKVIDKWLLTMQHIPTLADMILKAGYCNLHSLASTPPEKLIKTISLDVKDITDYECPPTPIQCKNEYAEKDETCHKCWAKYILSKVYPSREAVRREVAEEIIKNLNVSDIQRKLKMGYPQALNVKEYFTKFLTTPTQEVTQ